MNKSKDKVIVAVSGGPDSMALLDMTRKKYETIYCAHVNYHQRQSAQRDQEIVEEYCKKNSVECYVKHFDQQLKGNFQKQARDFRYNYFSELAEQLGVEVVLVAHQRDDVIETYIMQKERGSIPSYYGLNEVLGFKNVHISRPLLNYSKQELIDYLVQNKLNYGEDETNQSIKYTRNRIRKEKLAVMTLEDKLKMIEEIEYLNATRRNEKSTEIKVEDLLREKDQSSYLRSMFEEQPTNEHIADLIRQISVSNKRLVIEVKGKLLIKEYGLIKLIEKPQAYEVKLSEIKETDYRWFKVVGTADRFHSATVSIDDFPLTIRSPQPEDKIKLTYGTKSIARWFIDHKVPYQERILWPIVLNKHQEIILVPQIGCSLEYYSNNPNLFVIK